MISRNRSRLLATLALLPPSSAKETVSLPEGPVDWLGQLSLEKVQVVFVYGLGNGDGYALLRHWLKKDQLRRLVFLETKSESIRALLSDNHPLFEDLQVDLELLLSVEEGDSQLQELAIASCHKPFHFAINPAYDASIGEEIKRRLCSHRITHDSIATKAFDPNAFFYRQFYANLRQLPGVVNGAKLKNCFKGVPAIICGAGPSLDAQLSALSGLQERALIVGCGSGFTALTRAGLVPHLAAALSPTEDEGDRFFHARGFGAPCAFRMRLDPLAHALIDGPRIYTQGCCGMEIVRWLEEELELEDEPLQDGPSVVYFATDLAYRLGCNPIVYVGVDLAYTGGLAYSTGVGVPEGRLPGTLLYPSVDGGRVHTRWPWVCESELIGRLIASRADRCFVNATGGGIGIPGVANSDLGTLSKSWPLRDVTGCLHAALIEATAFQVTEERVRSLLSQLGASLLRSLGLLENLLSAEGPAALYEVELQEELAYRVIFNQLLSQRRLYRGPASRRDERVYLRSFTEENYRLLLSVS